MRTVRFRFPLATAAAVLLLASPAWGQLMVKPAKGDLDTPPSIYRMEIYNGPMRTVHYVTPSYMSPGDSASLRELEKAENEMALVDQLYNLRAQYAVNEQALEAKRRTMQDLLYGYNRDESSTYAAGASGPATFGWGGWGGLPVAGGMYGWLGNGWGGGAFSQVTASGNSSHSLAVGVGANEGAIKNAVAQNLMSPVLSEHAALAYRNYKAALARLDDSPRLRDGMGLPDSVSRATPAEFDPKADVLFLKDGSKIVGKIVKEDADWISIETTVDKAKRTEMVRTTEITRMSRPGEVKPASNDKD